MSKIMRQLEQEARATREKRGTNDAHLAYLKRRMNRRGFLSSILALSAAPAIVRADSLMRIVPRETAVLTGVDLAIGPDITAIRHCFRVGDLVAFSGGVWSTAERYTAEFAVSVVTAIDDDGSLLIADPCDLVRARIAPERATKITNISSPFPKLDRKLFQS